ncbi:MAG: DUF3108 domain-containing protein [Bacteroidota bacterium]
MIKQLTRISCAIAFLIYFVVLFGFVEFKIDPNVDCSKENNSFAHGEELIYKAYYNWKIVWIPAGEVRFRVYEYENEYQLEAVGKSYTSYDNFFRVRDYYSTRIDKKTLIPKTFVRNIEEGNYRKFDSLNFDQKNNVVHSFNGKVKEEAQYKQFAIDSCTLDLLSVMYSLRNTNVDAYKPGDYLDIEMFIDEEMYPIHVIYEEKEEKKIKDMGKFPTLKIKPELIVGNVFKKGDVMNIWVTDDLNKIPLLIESPISIGSVKAVLKSYSGLRNATILEHTKE